jgi:F-type H+-transporting ATPase subunit epsilon
MATLRLAIVTPERTELDKEVATVTLPMIDGQLGVLPGRAPMIGRLGYGFLRYKVGEQEHKHFVDGGFVQIEANIVSVLTSRLLSIEALKAADAERELTKALALPSDNDAARSIRDTAIARARGLLYAATRA